MWWPVAPLTTVTLRGWLRKWAASGPWDHHELLPFGWQRPRCCSSPPLSKAITLIPSMSASGCYTQCEEYEPPVCEITDIQGGVQQACDPLSLTYTQQVILTYENAPADGFLVINGDQSALERPRHQPWWASADGQPASISAYFSTDEGCSRARNVFTVEILLRFVSQRVRSSVCEHHALDEHVDCPSTFGMGALSVAGIKNFFSPASTGRNMMIQRVKIRFHGKQDWLAIGSCCSSQPDCCRVRAVGPTPPPTIYTFSNTRLRRFGRTARGHQDQPHHPWGMEPRCGPMGRLTPCNARPQCLERHAMRPRHQHVDLTFGSTGSVPRNRPWRSTRLLPCEWQQPRSSHTLPASVWVELNAFLRTRRPAATMATPASHLKPVWFAGGHQRQRRLEVSDVLLVLSDFGCTQTAILTDLDGDGSITVADVLTC